jgi:hypothetical protein
MLEVVSPRCRNVEVVETCWFDRRQYTRLGCKIENREATSTAALHVRYIF